MHFTAWLTLLLVLLGGAGLVWHRRLLRAHAAATRPEPPPLPRWLRRRALAAAALAGLLLFAGLAWAVAADGWWVAQDDRAFRALQAAVGNGALRTLAVVTWFGDTATLIGIGLGVAALLAWRRQWLLLGAWAVGTLGSWTLLVWTKNAFARARPDFLHDVVSVNSYSFPSGHAAGSLVVYGLAAWLAVLFVPSRWRLPLALGAGLLVAAVSASRVLLQVHYLTDVLAGLLLGLAWLVVVVGSAERARRRYL